jgi:DNA polymerase-1
VESSGTELPPAVAMRASESGVPVRTDATYVTADTVEAVAHVIERARATGRIAFDTETVADTDAPNGIDPLRCTLVGLSLAVAPGEAYYLPFAHRAYDGAGNLALLSGDAGIAGGRLQQAMPEPRNLPAITSAAMAPLRELLADAGVKKVAQHAKYDLLVLRSVGVALDGLDFDTMLASYILDPGRRSHGMDQLAFERLQHTMTSYEQLCGKGRAQLPFDVVPVDAARDYSCEDVDVTWRLMDDMAPALDASGMRELFDTIEVPLVAVLADMEWEGIAIDLDWFASLKTRFQRERERVVARVDRRSRRPGCPTREMSAEDDRQLAGGDAGRDTGRLRPVATPDLGLEQIEAGLCESAHVRDRVVVEL